MIIKIKNQLLIFLSLMLLILSVQSQSVAKEVVYKLKIEKNPINITGKEVSAITINGQMPGPTLFFTEGDTAVMEVTNTMPIPAIVHWHGLLVPNAVDGVPYVTTLPIPAGETAIYKFPLIQSGTYWYHSHFGLQEQYGLKGTIVIKPKNEPADAPRDVVLSIGDWNDDDPSTTLRTLKRNSSYFPLKKNQMQTIVGALETGTFGNVVKRNFYNVLDSDLSDVGYDAFITNGKKNWKVAGKPGEIIRLRVVNTSSSSYFYLNYAGGPLTVIAADGLDITPVKLDKVLMSIAESYDFLVTLPKTGQYEFRATSFDGTGFTSTWIGDYKGVATAATAIEQPDIYQLSVDMTNAMIAMKQKSNAKVVEKVQPKVNNKDKTSMPAMKKMDSMSSMKANEFTGGSLEQRPGAPYGKLHSPQSTLLKANRPWRNITLNLTGDMERYIWTFNGKTLAEDAYIPIKKGENVRIKLVNKTMMRHPMHLHGHFFRVVTDQGEYSTLKHTVDVAPMHTTVIEFAADEEKDWFFHCHNLYHMAVGMERIVHYEGTEVAPDVMAERDKAFKDPWYTWSNAGFYSQMTEGLLQSSNTRNTVALNWQYDWNKSYDVTAGYYRYFNRYFSLFGGVNASTDFPDHENRGVVGFYYLLPFAIGSLNWVDDRGNVRTQLSRPFQITDRLNLITDYQYDSYSKQEWGVGLNYWLTRRVSATINYNSSYGGGAGLSIRF
ncbi:multicopper oxidase domain-containing protein [Shewanella surugensis]|uniref:Multicopper oxidase domain-containing protein n=1 Tax=Shewanella surugensis TaxID=212020 RepID=A0ABT0L6P5_9GAMM|nr:multicopper oxidase domain-containing protein [Shewanella surugensis]MCL1123362.1 multicopper oxidase domain-containing protein [Shewanella surugensis]